MPIPGPQPEKLPDVTKLDSTMPIGQEPRGPAERPFEDFMIEATPKPEGAEQSNLITPFDLAGQSTPLAQGPSFDSLSSQMITSEHILNDLQNQFSTPQLNLRQSERYLVGNKLTEAEAHFRSAAQTIGAPVAEPTPTSLTAGPLQKFVGLISDSLTHVHSAQTHLSGISERGDELNPADFLLVQMKMNKGQQGIEYSSVLLSKAIEAMKTMMNIQL